MRLDILVVEDHPLMRGLLAQNLQKLWPHAQVSVAEDLERGIEQATKLSKQCLVVLDLGLPGKAGLASLRQFRNAVPHARVLVFSAADELHVLQQAKHLGAYGFVAKDTY